MNKVLFVSIVFFISCKSYSQGCSDAGFCSLKYHEETGKKEYNNMITLGNVSGLADGNTFINGTYLGYRRKAGRNFYWDTKLTANYSSGSLANNFNIGDVFTNFSYTVFSRMSGNSSLQVLGGIKIPLTASNDKAEGKPLPMAYQSSLGTWDLLLGVQYQWKNWEFTHAYQIPLTKQNKNSFIREYSPSDDFPTTNNFRRKTDILLRAAYQVRKETWNLSLKPNLLLIYHLDEDGYEDIFSKRQQLNGSKGITLNANLIGNYRINNRSSVELSLAAPFVVRDIRPDGLTRKFTAAIEYRFSF